MHRTLLIDLWGTGRGVLVRTAPASRLVAGVFVFWACLLSMPETATGLGYVAVTVVGWLGLSGMPRRTVGRLLAYGLAIFGPVFVLTPWIEPAAASERACLFADAALCIPWRIAVKGIGCMLVATATASTLSLCAFYEGLRRLPLPRLVVELLIQITHQTRHLVTETTRIQQAMAVRGAASGWRSSLLVVRSLPAVWLPRVLYRAERVSAAMELRAYGHRVPGHAASPRRNRDVLLPAAAAAWLLAGVLLHFSSPA